MKKIGMIFGGILLCALGTQASAATNLVEKSYDDCHHAVYGRAELILGSSLPVTLGTVPVSHVGPLRNIKLKNSIYTVKHTGTYVIHYYVRAFSEAVLVPSLDIAVSVNGRLRGYKKLLCSLFNEGLIFEGNGIILENLKKGDHVSLVIAKLPEAPFQAGVTASSQESLLAMKRPELRAKESDLFYFNVDEQTPDIAAYLILHKAEQE